MGANKSNVIVTTKATYFVPDALRVRKVEDLDHQECTIQLPEGRQVPYVSESMLDAQGPTHGRCSIKKVLVENNMKEQMEGKIHTNKFKSY